MPGQIKMLIILFLGVNKIIYPFYMKCLYFVSYPDE